jgi:putative transposase
MARLPRLFIPNEVQYVILDTISGVNPFPTLDDQAKFYSLLVGNAKRHDLKIHAYSMLPSGVQLLVTPGNDQSLSKTIQGVGRTYVALYNRAYKRSGTLWQGRYRATVVDSAEWFLRCSVLIDAEAVTHQLPSKASSHLHNLGVSLDTNLTPHAEYWALGNTPFERQAAYSKLVAESVSEQHAKTIIKYAHAGWVLGSEEYRAAVAPKANRRIDELSRGRPRKDGLPVVSTLAKEITMREKYVDEKIGIYMIWGTRPDGTVDVADQRGDIFDGVPKDIAEKIIAAHDLFRHTVYDLLCTKV